MADRLRESNDKGPSGQTRIMSTGWRFKGLRIRLGVRMQPDLKLCILEQFARCDALVILSRGKPWTA